MALNWYIKLKQISTTDEKAKELLTALETASPEEQAQAKETAKQYVESLPDTDAPEKIDTETQITVEDSQPAESEEELDAPEEVDITYLCAEELRALRAKIIDKRKQHEKTKLADMSYDEKKAHNKKDFVYAVKIAKINEKLQTIRKQERVALRKSEDNNILRKQSEFLNLLTHGISINNIITKSELIRNIDNLVAIMTPDFIDKCEKKYFGFRALWKRWYEKYVDNGVEKTDN